MTVGAHPEPLVKALDEYAAWSDKHASFEQAKIIIDNPLYHYTDGNGLRGILANQSIWFTDYRHLNDPSELIHGIEMAHDVIRLLANGADGRVGLFLQTITDMFSEKNFSATLNFFISSFSKARDDLGQWRSYADNGRGYAIGFAPRHFRIESPTGTKPNDNIFVGPVLYGVAEVCNRHELAISEVAAIFLKAAEANATILSDKSVGIPFMQDMARAIIASPFIWNSLTSKHPAYEHEQEVRLVMLGQHKELKPHITTRFRGSEIVPYIPHKMSLRSADEIVEIVVGPSAPRDAEHSLRTLLDSLGIDANVPISRSDIPYRAP